MTPEQEKMIVKAGTAAMRAGEDFDSRIIPSIDHPCGSPDEYHRQKGLAAGLAAIGAMIPAAILTEDNNPTCPPKCLFHSFLLSGESNCSLGWGLPLGCKRLSPGPFCPAAKGGG